ncbi:arylsulfatase [Microbacterium thalassium]|uniref:Arylsulfatase n=1 Tax=Microbacterium thalassium TaxID=362649 RepID=A0A7X0FPG2_9MICO|nr:arylsulfatase [Microbacterium thalassium]MBB6390697.1 arylsulfatase [Microbacterium thalassium]GLK25806.1 arylsulfatase [Microbacterium thalassium]
MIDDDSTPDLRHTDGASPRGYDGFGGVVAPRSSQSTPWWPAPKRAPEKAPNVIVILIDDMGFSDVSPFGSEIDTPAIQALADDGYRLTNFHVAPVCSPTRAALMTGCNPHRAGVGSVANMNPGYPGIRGGLPTDMPTLAETFRGNGYATLMVGKWHLTPETEMHDGASTSTWPIQRGFDRYFGSLEGFTTMYHPHRILRDNSPVTEEFADDDYLTDRLTSEAIDMIDGVRSSGVDRPFFLYFAHNAVHGPVQAKPADMAAHRGAYDAGWDAVRAARFERQKELGLFDADAEISPSGPQNTQGVPPWDSLDESTRELYARHMEVYAGAVTGIDDSVARLVAHLKDIGEYENTIIVFASDNGGTSEGGVNGTRSYFSQFTFSSGLPDDWVADVERPLDELGGPRVFGHYPAGWAHVSNTPFRLYKGTVHEGGIRSPLIVSWPAGLPRGDGDRGVRGDFAFVADLAPTLEELCGVTRPTTLRGAPAADPDGSSFAAALRPTEQPSRPTGQHVSFLGQRSYFEGRFKLVGMGWERGGGDGPAFWRLYDVVADPAEVHDLAADHPDVVADLAEKWRLAAWHNTVFPLPDEPTMLVKIPSTDLELEQPVRLRPGAPTLERVRSYKLIALRSFAVEARFGGALGEGVIVSHGDQGGGYILFAEDSALRFSYNAYGDMHRTEIPLASDPSTVTLAFDALDGFAWRITAVVDGVSTVLVDRVPMLIGMAPFTGISAGFDGGGPVDWELHERRGWFRYSGGLRDVRYTPGAKAPYNDEIVVAIDEISARLID